MFVTSRFPAHSCFPYQAAHSCFPYSKTLSLTQSHKPAPLLNPSSLPLPTKTCACSWQYCSWNQGTSRCGHSRITLRFSCIIRFLRNSWRSGAAIAEKEGTRYAYNEAFLKEPMARQSKSLSGYMQEKKRRKPPLPPPQKKKRQKDRRMPASSATHATIFV